MARIFVIDDDAAMCRLLERLLVRENHDVRTCSRSIEALAILETDIFDVVLSDFYMPEATGSDILQQVRSVQPQADVIIMTAFATIEHAVDAMRNGAYDYIVKPFENDTVIHAIRRVIEKRVLRAENQQLRQELIRRYSFQSIVGQSPAMQGLFGLIEKIADSHATVSIQGESGTGKELVARAIHYSSHRARKNFVAVNCSALPDTLLESELFGHAKGSFTGATESRQGLIQHAEGGTLFLDEIADTSAAVQAKLLRVLQEKKIRRLGDTAEIEVNVRVITATSRVLSTLVQDNLFREDLFYRINVFPLSIPPLRERRDDIPLLLEHFLRGRKTIESPALDALMGYDWPGNIRELENLVERLCVFVGSPLITYETLPQEITCRPASSSSNHDCGAFQATSTYQEAKEYALNSFHSHYLNALFRDSGGNVTRAAVRAGLDRANLQRLVRRYDFDTARFRE
ncbi:sigma-54-dependent transcriptional regulator [Chrysiogenes arsenatis]|uniref:sigma-54-dependent transcriptional regulator n=1 Tax=Chrysiogenes arsenatis TaxID=309797 RepID=UPI000415E7B3|nr:sigma-54 dependent transcriptional regulator [Chrysiogenes arsenatis]